MLKVYGADICTDCRNFKALVNNRSLVVEYIDITENVINLREFLKIRDNSDIFNDVKQRGGIGIPLFINDDQSMTFDVNEALAWIGEEPMKDEEIVEHIFSCGINGCK